MYIEYLYNLQHYCMMYMSAAENMAKAGIIN